MMEYNKEDITTYSTTIILAITTYMGVSEATSGLLMQILAPILAILLSLILTYYNEKYPSNLVTKTYTRDEVESLAQTIIEDDAADGI